MFIRYNQAAKYYEYDTSAAQNGSGPWAILPLDGNISGGFPANVAYIDRTNVFGFWQRINSSYPIILLTKTDSGVDGKNWRMENLGNFYISSTNDADNAYQQRFVFDRSGGLTVPGSAVIGNNLDVGAIIRTPNYVIGGIVAAQGNNGRLNLYDTGGPVNARQWTFLQPNNGDLYVLPADDAGTGQANTIIIHRNSVVEFPSQYTQHNLGAYFPYTSSNASLLDHYEEGTWAPTVVSSDGGVGTSYSIQNGGFSRIGNIVTCDFDVQIQAANWGSGTVFIGGLPFVNSGYFSSGTISYYTITGGVYWLGLFLNNGATTANLQFKNSLSGTVDGSLLVGNVQPGFRIIGSIVYRTNT